MNSKNNKKEDVLAKIKELIFANSQDSLVHAMQLMIDLDLSDNQWFRFIPKAKTFDILETKYTEVFNKLLEAANKRTRLQEIILDKLEKMAENYRYTYLGGINFPELFNYFDSYGHYIKGPLSWVESLTDNAANVLANYKKSLDLNGLTNLSDTAIFALAKHKEDGYYSNEGFIYLNGLASLSNMAAQAFVQYKGTLSLNAEVS